MTTNCDHQLGPGMRCTKCGWPFIDHEHVQTLYFRIGDVADTAFVEGMTPDEFMVAINTFISIHFAAAGDAELEAFFARMRRHVTELRARMESGEIPAPSATGGDPKDIQ